MYEWAFGIYLELFGPKPKTSNISKITPIHALMKYSFIWLWSDVQRVGSKIISFTSTCTKMVSFIRKFYLNASLNMSFYLHIFFNYVTTTSMQEYSMYFDVSLSCILLVAKLAKSMVNDFLFI